MHRRGDGQQPFFFGVAVEAGHRAQPAGDGGPSATSLLQGPGVGLDIGSAGREQRQAAVGAPAHVLAQIKSIGVTSGAPVAGQEGR